MRRVYTRNTMVPINSVAAMYSSTAGKPYNAATTPVLDLHQGCAEEERQVDRGQRLAGVLRIDHLPVMP